MPKTQIQFEITLTGGPDGQLRAAYIHLRRAKVARTDEVVEDTVLADYDAQDRLVGIEMLGPAKVKVLVKLVDEKHRAAFRRFVTENVPQKLMAA